VFRPEFLNRLDDVIVFRHLTTDDLKDVIDMELSKVRERLAIAASPATDRRGQGVPDQAVGRQRGPTVPEERARELNTDPGLAHPLLLLLLSNAVLLLVIEANRASRSTTGWSSRSTSTSRSTSNRGRDRRCRRPPAQIRT
jgi:hypothetical protein